MTDADVARWRAQAARLPARQVVTPGMPVGTLLLEALAAATFLETYWEPDSGVPLPGMKAVAVRVPLETAEQIRSLVRAGQVMHERAQFPSGAARERKARLRELQEGVAELDAVLAFTLEGTVDDPALDALAAARERHGASRSLATLLQAAMDYAHLGKRLRARMVENVADFDVALVERVRALSLALGKSGAPGPGRPASLDVDLRNRLLVLLDQRVKAVRRAARFVFRRHPEVARRAGSTHERQKRSAARHARRQTAG